MGHGFERKRRIFRNKDALGNLYRPETIEERDDEIKEYMDALQPVVDGWEPNNIFLYGNTGVGKTAITDYLMDRLQKDVTDYDDVDLSVISAQFAKTLNSSYQVVVELVNTPGRLVVRSVRRGIHSRPFSTNSTKRSRPLEERFFPILDEVDSIGDRDDLLYRTASEPEPIAT